MDFTKPKKPEPNPNFNYEQNSMDQMLEPDMAQGSELSEESKQPSYI